ncbi:MAG: hypothetical protein ACK4K7_10320 [Allosphingosinicella sp.]|uniref:hypothetical protein n=1 Tax=Allosphingosinicella sp. TaxID=2823234 RepID=UPI00393ECE7B
MLKQRKEAAQQVADRLFAAEQAIDEALARAAELNAAMPAARSRANLAAQVGQDALEAAAESFAALVRARHQIVEAHRRLDAAKTQIGLRTVAIGGGMEKPPMGRAAHLSIVDGAAA